MAIEINTKISIGENNGKGIPNLILEDAKFFGRPNFKGELDRFKDDRRKFTVLIPNDVADQLREIGYNVKTNIPTAEELQQFPDREPISHLKVMVDEPVFEKDHNGEDHQVKGPELFIKQGDELERLNPATVGLIDRSKFDELGMEIRGWEYDPEEQPGQYSARLVQFIGVMPVNALEAKYGRLR